MKTYFLAIYSPFEGINKLFCVLAENEFEAAKKATLLHAGDTLNDEYKIWVDSFKSVDDLLEQMTNCDLSISNFLSC